MRDYVNLSEFGTFEDLIYGMPVRVWKNEPQFAKVSDKGNFRDLLYFKWRALPGKGMGMNGILQSGVVGFMEHLHLDQVWVESGWAMLVLK